MCAGFIWEVNLAMPAKNDRGQTLDEFLAEYDENKYRRPSVAVDMAVFTIVERLDEPRLAILLIKRRDHPCLGEWALPGGFLNMDEEIEAAASRELYEETHVGGLRHKFIGVFANVGRDPRTRTISLSHMALAPKDSLTPEAGDDAALASLFEIDAEVGESGLLQVVLTATDAFGLTLDYTTAIAFDLFSGYTIHAEKGDIAFDHSKIITKALIELAALPENETAMILSPDSPEDASALLQKIRSVVVRAVSYSPQTA